MANLTTSKDIKDYVLFHADEPTDGSSDFNDQSVEEVNRAYENLWAGGSPFDPTISEKWWWLKKEGSIILEPKRDAGTVAVTNGSTTITLSAAPGTATLDLDNYFFRTTSFADIFKLTTGFTGTDTSLTLDTVYTGDTTSEASFRLFKLDYSLPTDVYKLIDPMIVYQRAGNDISSIGGGPPWISEISLGEMDRGWPLNHIQGGSPSRFAPTDEQTIRFNRYGGTATGDLIRIDFDYLRRPAALTTATTDIPAVPKHYNYIIADMALHYVMELKGDDRNVLIASRATQGLKAMQAENRRRWAQAGLMGEIMPRQGRTKSFGVLRTETGLLIG